MSEENENLSNTIETVEIPVRGLSEPLRFDSLDALSAWIEKEEQFWKWLQNDWDRFTDVRDWVSPAFNAWSRGKKFIRNDRGNTEWSAQSRADNVQRIRDTFATIYSEPRIILSDDPRAQYIDILKDNDAVEASFSLLTFLQPARVPMHPPAVRGMIKAFLFDKGLVDQGAVAEKASLRLAVTDWQSHIGQARQESKDQKAEIEILKNELVELRDSVRERFNSTYESANAELRKIAHTYDQQLSLEKPVTYWKNRVILHSIWAGGLAAVWLLAASGAGYSTLKLVQAFMLPQLTPAGEYVVAPQQLYYWHSFLVVGTILMFLWPLRVLAKLFLSNMHLRTEALERVTMANTFLALIRQEKEFPADERKLLLEALFRPSSIGLIQEDGAPASVMHTISKLMSGDRR